MDIKKKIAAAKQKVTDHIHRNRGTYGYFVGFGVASAAWMLGSAIGTAEAQRRREHDYDVYDKAAQLRAGSDDAFATYDRHGDIYTMRPKDEITED